MIIRALGNAIVTTLIAPVCACCREPLDDALMSVVCARCWSLIPPPAHPLCEVCGDSLASWRTVDEGGRRCVRCRRKPRVISRGRSIAPYEGVLREILHAFKYEKRRSLARQLAARMIPAGEEILRDADCVIPVPLHRWRHLRRGFNQAAELARHLDRPVVHALTRTRATVTQTDLPEAQRHANVFEAFRVRRAAQVRCRIVVVVDDVSTTGATLDACARILLDAGAKEVRALTAARAAARLPA